jgi:hypothetical protein
MVDVPETDSRELKKAVEVKEVYNGGSFGSVTGSYT